MTTTYQAQLLDKLNSTRFKSIDIEINKARTIIFQKTLTCHIDYCLNWLENQTIFPKVYWKEKNSSETLITLGVSCQFEKLPDIKTFSRCKHPPKVFGAFAFNKKTVNKVNPWEKLPANNFFIPEYLLYISSDGTAELIYQTFDKNKPIKELIDQSATKGNYSFSSSYTRVDTPSKKQYKTLLEKALNLIEEKTLQKIVLSRLVTLTFKEKIPGYHLLEKLQNSSQNTTVFGWFLNDSTCFIGSSPENLYRRDKENIFTHAIAGTKAKGNDVYEEKLLSDQLIQSEKDLNEFNLVVDYIHSSLKKLCDSHSKGHLKVLSTSTVQHFCQEFHGSLKLPFSDHFIISKLHPTPAMGGLPKSKALMWINKLEPYTRGYYSSILGWFSYESTNALISIRSALIDNNILQLFSGGGIVKESDYESEWNELELKISQYMKIL